MTAAVAVHVAHLIAFQEAFKVSDKDGRPVAPPLQE